MRKLVMAAYLVNQNKVFGVLIIWLELGLEKRPTANERTLPRSLDYASSLGLRSAR